MGSKEERAERRRRSPSFQERLVARWNRLNQVGTTVAYYEVVKADGSPDCDAFVTKTRTPAELLSGHTAVVWIEGKPGCVCVEHCFVIE